MLSLDIECKDAISMRYFAATPPILPLAFRRYAVTRALIDTMI